VPFRLFLIPLLTVGILAAQDPPSRVGRLNFINGNVSFQPGGGTDWVPATVNRPLTVGDQVFADEGARAEIHVSGITFRLGSKTAFEFLNLDDRNVQVRLSEGTLNVRVRRLNGENVEVDTPNQAFTIQRPGAYRIDANPDNNQTSVTVRDGNGEVTTNSGAFGVQARQEAVLDGQDQVQYNVYDAPGADDFDNWAQSRDQHDDRSQSSRYVSQDMVGYEDLDDNGSWQNVPEYGQAWIPRSVPDGWAPYHNGHWAWIDPWGWSWVDDAPWGFAPFHYGRWASFSGRWGWVPGPVAVAPVYAPALVAWFGVGGGGLQISAGFGGEGAGWFPLGPRDVYLPAYQASPAYVTRINTTNTTVINNTQITNVYNNYTRTGNSPIASYSNRNVPGAAVAVSHNVLASGRPVQQAAVRITPNQVAGIRAVSAAPRVAPQFPAAARTANVPRPAAAVMSRSIVAKATPPPPPASFQQRQAVLAKNPGQPIPMQQLHQMAQSAPQASAARPQVRVMAQARQVTPQVMSKPAPRPGSGAGASPQAGSQPANQVQRPTPQAQPNRPQVAPSEQPRVQAQPNRTPEPPASQHPAPQAQPTRPQVAPSEQPRVQAQPNRTSEPPASQRPATQAQPTRPSETPREQPHVQPQSRPAPQAQPTQRAEPSREQPRVQPQSNRPTSPPPQAERRVQPPPQRTEARPNQRTTAPPAKPRPADDSKKKTDEKPPR
jgi:hypothetical protein